MPPPRITLRDIADRAGVTAATVSLALRDSSEVSVERRTEIKRLAKHMGYRPDPALSALAEYRRGKRIPGYQEHLAFLYQAINGESFETWSDWPVRLELIAGIKSRAAELGYGLEIHDIGVEESRQKATARMLRARGIRGILTHIHLQPPEDVLRHFHAFAALNILQFSEKSSFNSVRSNDYEAMRIALLRLYELGYRYPLYVRTEPTHGLFGPEKMGGLDWFKNEFPHVLCRHVFHSEFQAHAREILCASPPVDVILTHDGYHNGQFGPTEREARKVGIRIPEDCGICFLFASPRLPYYGGIDIQGHLVGKRSVEAVDLMLRHNEIGPLDSPSTLLTSPRWQDGPSIPPRAEMGEAITPLTARVY